MAWHVTMKGKSDVYEGGTPYDNIIMLLLQLNQHWPGLATAMAVGTDLVVQTSSRYCDADAKAKAGSNLRK